jgi:hypothetical protein
MSRSEARIFFCPRFHVNFYHSYRGDTADEQGFGKDIRIIRGILDDLDRLQRENLNPHCSWDFDNVFSLGEMIPQHAPDILERIGKRVAAGLDEIHMMSWNNGLLSAHTTEEFKLAIGWALKAPDGSGNLDTFKACTTIVRPQECMITPSHLRLYHELGIETVSVYYSSIPFNGFGSFLPRLPVEKRYNPLRLTQNGTDKSLRVLPAINQGDLAEYGLSARRMLKSIRRQQSRMNKPTDLIVLLDMDADDTFWEGLVPPALEFAVPSFAGFHRLIKSVASLPFVDFINPSTYLASHEDAGTISLGQDTADGAFDGFASWAEKYDNHMLWAKVTQARVFWDAARQRVIESHQLPASAAQDFNQWSAVLPKNLRELAIQAISTRLRVLSTTHFGLSAPVMNVHRLTLATKLGETAIELARALMDAVETTYRPKTSATATSLEATAPVLEPQQGAGNGLSVEPQSDGRIVIQTDYPDGRQTLTVNGPWVEHGKKIHHGAEIRVCKSDTWCMTGIIPLGRDSQGNAQRVNWERNLTLDPRSATLVIDCTVAYPFTDHQGFGKVKAERLQRTWDARWKQIAPFEIIAFHGLPLASKVTVWKQDFGGTIGSYQLDYYQWGGNRSLTSINNHVTPSWIALSDGIKGVLVAQCNKNMHGFAFCPLRQTIVGETQHITMNPFGSYWGPQYKYPCAVTGWGRAAALLTAEHLFPSAPSWEGKTVDFSLLVALYSGGCPPQVLRDQAEAFTRNLL